MKKFCAIVLMLWASGGLSAEKTCPENGFDGALCHGHLFISQGKPMDALVKYAEAEELASAPFEKMLAITFQARANHAADQIEQALALYQNGFEAANLANAAQGKWINLNEMSELLLGRKEAQKALEGFTQGYKFAANDNERAESNRLIASAYKQLGDYDHAIEYQLKSSLLERRSGDLNTYLRATLELAALRTVAKDYAQAQKNLDEALRQAKAAQSNYWQAVTLLYQARLESAQNHVVESAKFLASAKALAKSVGDETLSKQLDEEDTQAR